jgi:ADP-heptose:LPS heptosyltransferase
MSIIKKYHENAISCGNQNDDAKAIEYYHKILNELMNPAEKCMYIKELGFIYKKIEKYEKAIECFMDFLNNSKYFPDTFEKISNVGVTLNEVGCCYFKLEKYKEAIDFFYRVIQIQEIASVYGNIGNCYVCLKKYEIAEKNLLKGHALDKNDNNINLALGKLYYYMKEYKKSIKYYNLIKNVEDALLYDFAFTYLAMKNFKMGWKYHHYRLLTNPINQQTKLKERLDIPEIQNWDGIAKCNRLLVVYEQGIGDNIQFYRFVIQLSELYPEMKISYFCRETVNKLFKTCENIEIINVVNMLIYDYKVYIMSLPKILNLEVITPNKVNYININEEKLLYWKDKLMQFKNKKIGFTNVGLLSSFIEKHIPLQEFEIFAELNIDLICLHKKSEIEKELTNITLRDKIHYFDIDNDIPFHDTIHILKNIDLLITIDTYIVHLAGVLNVRTLLLLGNYSEWRWSNEDTTYWYDSVELIRLKDKSKDFKEVLKLSKKRLLEILHEDDESDIVNKIDSAQLVENKQERETDPNNIINPVNEYKTIIYI